MQDKITRRELLRRSAAAGISIAGIEALEERLCTAEPEESPGRSKVVIVTDQALISEEGVDQKTAEKMLRKGLISLTGLASAVEAWKSLFKPSDVVGIKVNCLFGKGVSTRPEIAYAVVAGLEMAGVKRESIIIWDRSSSDLIKCGYSPNKGEGVQVLADDGDWGQEASYGSFHGRLSKILTDKITALINLPILKTHGITGISGALKNHYGTFDNPGAAHVGGGNPWMADLNALPQIKDKTRLIVMDAARPLCDGGPGLKTDALFDYNSLIISKDPAATDRVGLDIINERRKQIGKPELTLDKIKWLASAEKAGVGVCNLSKIDLVKI